MGQCPLVHCERLEAHSTALYIGERVIKGGTSYKFIDVIVSIARAHGGLSNHKIKEG